MSEAVILIPGFLGFGRFGTPPGTVIEYFTGVRQEIERARSDLAGRVLVHEPPPTGSIHERTASLHDAVLAVKRGEALRNNPPIKADRIHLVGHSAGGVDARLFANSAFFWTGGPRGKERAEALKSIETVVTVAAPLGGTPIAKNAVLERDIALLGVYALSILGMAGIRLPAERITTLFRTLRLPTPSSLAHSVLDFADDLDDATDEQLRRYFTKLIENRQLMRQLTVESMQKTVAPLTPTDHERLHCFVSVSPEPSGYFPHFVERLLYRLAYAATEGAIIGPVPEGPSLGGRTAQLLQRADASDGVVPVTSQTVTGKAAGIVEGDHFDLVGHFAGGPGVTLFKSDSGFDLTRLRALWSRVALSLGKDHAALRAVG